MIKQFCDSCGDELPPDTPTGYSELDTYATEGRTSYHFHVQAVGLKLCQDHFLSLLQESLNTLIPPIETPPPRPPVIEKAPEKSQAEEKHTVHHESKKR